MFIKSAAIAALAFAASVASQSVPNHTYFTNPVGNDMVYTAGKNITFSWAKTCVSPSDSVSTTPTAAKVQLINSNNSTNAYFVADVTTIDCQNSAQGNTYWVVPTDLDPSSFYSLQIVLTPTNAYSGKFKVNGGSGGSATTSAPSSTTSDTTSSSKSGANSVTAGALASAFAVVAGALML
ncbi:hypothetical protein BGX21_001329 [Mortierella sp. AD011]|nr:hypothetical protein BGX20_000341 [Mortierella sp. AD010]KAF9384322.1 hypothetical protein BGX21_001329 [Mortierella sp. AD011]